MFLQHQKASTEDVNVALFSVLQQVFTFTNAPSGIIKKVEVCGEQKVPVQVDKHVSTVLGSEKLSNW